MQKRCLVFIVCLLAIGQCFSQKKKFKSYNAFIEQLNNQVDYINSEQQKLLQYHQDFFRYYRIFDTLTVKPYERISFEKDSLFTDKDIPIFVQVDYAQLNLNQSKFDSIITSINFDNDLAYSQEKIDSLNERSKMIRQLSNEMQRNIEDIQKAFLETNLESRKSAYKLMLEELEKVDFLITKVKRGKLELVELEYEIPMEVQKELPPSYLAILQEFQNRLADCKQGDNREEIIHYFLPKKYFDKWILNKYSIKYWQIKYLEDVVISPIFERGLKTNYNTSVEDNSLQSIKSINEFETLPFVYEPPINSPLGRHKKVFFILILDISNSMNEDGKLEQLKSSVKSFVDALRPQDKFAIILFSNVSQELVLPGEKDTEFIKYEVDNIKAYGNTLPESAIFRAYNIMNLQTNKDYDNEIILITDGIFDVTGKMKYHITQGQKKDIEFSVINVEQNDENYSDIEKLTKVGKGTLYFIDDSLTYQTIINEILK